MAKYKPPPPEEGAPGWMMTFGDMCTLLLTFFVLLVSMMVIDPKKYTEVLGTFQDSGGVGQDIPTEAKPIPTEDFFKQIIKASSRRNNRPDGGEIVGTEGEAVRVFSFRENYVVQVAERSFFRDFEIGLTPGGMTALDQAATVILDTKMNRVRLQGHFADSETMDRWNKVAEDITVGGKRIRGRVLTTARFDPMTNSMVPEDKILTTPGDLAICRAQAVKQYLAYKGVPMANMEAIDGGKLGRKIKSGLENLAVSMKTGRSGFIAGKDGKIETSVVREGSAEAKAPQTQVKDGVLRNWPSFVFVENGGDEGRTVSISVTGEVVTEDAQYIGPLGAKK